MIINCLVKHGHYLFYPLFICHDHVSHIPNFYSWLSHRQKAETVQEICQSGEASWSLASLHSSWPSPSTKDWQESCWLRKLQNPNNVFFVGSPACYEFSLLYWWILMTSIGRQLVIKWSSSGHSHIWSSCLYSILMENLFHTSCNVFFFRPSTYDWSTPVGFNMSQLLLPPAAVAQRQVDPHHGHPAAIRQTSVPGPRRFGLAQVRIHHLMVRSMVPKSTISWYHHGWLNGTIMEDFSCSS